MPLTESLKQIARPRSDTESPEHTMFHLQTLRLKSKGLGGQLDTRRGGRTKDCFFGSIDICPSNSPNNVRSRCLYFLQFRGWVRLDIHRCIRSQRRSWTWKAGQHLRTSASDERGFPPDNTYQAGVCTKNHH